jgi:hypothetical protein
MPGVYPQLMTRGPNQGQGPCRSRDANLAVIVLLSCGPGCRRVGARQQVGQQQVPGARLGRLPALLARAG